MTVTQQNEIELNGNKYRIKGSVAGSWVDPFPEQMTLGDADYANRRDLSSWILNDLRAGIGVEEMDERVDGNRCWWTDCIIKYRNHIMPPRLATALTSPTTGVTTLEVINKDMEVNGYWATPAGAQQSNAEAHGGTYSWLITNSYSFVDMQFSNNFRGRSLIFKVWVKTAVASTGRIAIYDGEGTTYSSYHTGGGDWEQLTATRTIDASAITIRLYLYSTTANAAYFDDASLTESACTVGTANHMVNFNSQLYMAFGSLLVKMNSGRTGFDIISDMGADITALIASLNSKLYIYLGDGNSYWFMNTSEVFYKQALTTVYWGFQYDNKLFGVYPSGTVYYSANPSAVSPTWTSGGSITDIAAQIEGFLIGRDAAGAYTPYCATHSIIKAYDKDTPQWIDTEARLPNHPIGGRGHAYWNGKLYFSYGLAVKEYYPETGSFLDVGLTERDGLPSEYNGEIVKLLGDTGVKGMFAAVDASVPSGNSKSGLYLYDGGWQCWWVDTSNDRAMHDIIVSSASSEYAVYWDVGGLVYYIDIPRGIENPDKITQSYATSGILITPWFDAANPTVSKLAKLLTDFAKGITTTETVALKYRVDHANTDLDTGWATMDTLNTTGESGYNEELFASGAGLSFKAIQFRLDFVTPGATAKSDIQSLVFYYKKRTGSVKLRAWAVTVICDDYGLTSAKEKIANLKSAIESATDVLFSYHPNDASDESYYVTVNCNRFSEETGREYNANYELMLIET